MQNLSPTASQERIVSLDVLRGFAILGILIINIQSFAMPGAAYLNPMAYGDMTGLNKWVWMGSHIFADSKFMTIFSILFGAGIVLMTSRAEQKTGRSAGLHTKRNFWLLVIGLIHAHLIWHGDILVPYAICAFIVYFFRKMSPRSLVILGVVVLSIHTVLYLLVGMSIQTWPDESLASAMSSWAPDQSQLNAEIAAVTGTLSEQVSHNSETAVMMETLVFLFVFLWRASGLMLVGMAIYKWNILSAGRDLSFYRKGWIMGWTIGIPVVTYGVLQNFNNGWTIEYSMYFGSQFNYWGSLLVSFGHICAVLYLVKKGSFKWLQLRLAAVGQMALTNYLMQSFICVFIFWGVGFSLFGTVERKWQFLIVVFVWIVQLLWSKPWLQRFRFGPFEWLWRSASYGSWQPMKRAKRLS